MKEFLKQMAIKKFVKTVIVPLLPVLAVIVAVIAIISVILGATLGGSPLAGGDTNMDNIVDINDEETIELYTEFADNWNVWDTWLSKSDDGVPINVFLDSNSINTQDIEKDIWMDIEEIKKNNKKYSNYGNMTNVHSLMDRDRKDYDLINNWGTIHSYISWWMYQHTDTVQEIPEELFEEFIKELHPKFKYRTSVRTTCVWVEDEEGGGGCECSQSVEYLLIEADTMRGHFAYEYEWHTDVDSHGCETTYEVLKETIDLSPEGNRWYKIEQWLVEHLEVPESDAEDVRLVFLNAETAFKEKTDVIDWMLTGDPFIVASKIPLGTVPLHIQELCREAAEKYGIPVELLMAIAQRETGGTFNPTAYNPDSGATGLMQFMPDTWEAYKVDGDGDGVINIYSPADSIFSAANYLSSLAGNKMELKKDKETIISILAQYGGNPASNAAKEYANNVYLTALNFQRLDEVGLSGLVFPLKGMSLASVSSEYGMRLHPVKRIYKMHTGIDLPTRTGTPIYAVCGGKVFSATRQGDWGNCIRIVGHDQTLHLYAHLSKIDVSPNSTVKAGQIIGYVGSTGASTGPHLHYEIRRSPYGDNDHMSPIPYLQQAVLH